MISDKLNFYNIQALAKKTGLTRRTIHYYVQRGLLPKPEGGGRGHYYTEEHLRLIDLIQRWKDQGVPLEKMKELLSGRETPQINFEADTPVPDDFRVQHLNLSADRTMSDEKLSVHEPVPNYSMEEPYSETSEWTRITLGPDVEISLKSGTLSKEQQQAIKDFILSLIKNK